MKKRNEEKINKSPTTNFSQLPSSSVSTITLGLNSSKAQEENKEKVEDFLNTISIHSLGYTGK